MVPDEVDFRVVERTFLKNLLSAELVTTVYDRDFFREACQVDAFFHRRVASTDDEEFFFFKERAITDSTVRDTATAELFFTRYADFFILCTRRDDDRPCVVIFVVCMNRFVCFTVFDASNVSVRIFCAECFRVVEHFLREIGSEDAIVSWVVLDIFCVRHLTARNPAFDHQCRKVRT